MSDATPIISGWITRLQSGFYTVQTEQGVVTCQLRGRLKKGRVTGDIAAVGDRVQVMVHSDGSGSIESIDDRSSELVRLDPTPRGVYRQVLLANMEQVVFVFACAQPEPRLRMLDRFLVIAEKQELPPLIVANKVDLIGSEAARQLFQRYEDLGYPVLYTSAAEQRGIETLRERLVGRLTGFAGPSGVGKSSLLNTIQPGLGLAVREVSEGSKKGRHTTVVRELFALKEGGYVVDLPGLKSLALWDTEPEELDGYFPELRDRVAACQFNDCTHRNEPGCAVRLGLEQGDIHPERYDSYLRLRFGDED